MTASVITSILVPVLYVAGALALIPAMVRDRFRALRAEYSSACSDKEIQNKAVWEAFGFSLIWPVYVFILLGRYSLDKDARTLSRQQKEEKDLELAERRMALHIAAQEFKKSHEETQWLQTFNQFDRDAKKS